MSVSKVKQFFWSDFQNLTQLEDHIKGNADITKLNGADMTAIDIYQFGELQLRQFFSLSVIYNIQSKLFVQSFIFSLHGNSTTFTYNCREEDGQLNLV